MIQSPWVLVLIVAAVALWARGARRASPNAGDADDTPWDWRIDPLLAFVCGVVYAVVAAYVLAPHYVRAGDYGDVDFVSYCSSLGASRDGTTVGYYRHHSALIGALLAPVARSIGVLGTLTGGSIVAGGVFASGLYLWARIAAGRAAGIWTVLLAAACQQLLWISRSPSFYPETTAACVLGTAGMAAALRWRTPRALLCGGLGTGLIFSSDARFFTVGVWCAALLVLPVVSGGRAGLLRRAAMAFLPVLAWWCVARVVHDSVLHGERATGVLVQSFGFVSDVPGYPRDAFHRDALKEIDHVWGVSPPWKIPGALIGLVRISRLIPNSSGMEPEALQLRTAYLLPWAVPVAAGVLAALVALWRRPWALLAGLGLTVPYIANLMLVYRTLPHPRFAAMGMVSVPVILGVGIGAFGGGRWARAPFVVLGLFLVGAVSGVIPGFLSPTAAWRLPICANNRVYDALARATPPGVRLPRLEGDSQSEDSLGCQKALESDVAAGHVWVPFADAPVPAECHPDDAAAPPL